MTVKSRESLRRNMKHLGGWSDDFLNKVFRSEEEVREAERDFKLAEFEAACERMRETRRRKNLIFEGIMIAMEEMNKGDDNPGPRIMERLDKAAERGRDV